MIIRKCDICAGDMDSEASAEQTHRPWEFPVNGIVKAVAIIRLKGMDDPADSCEDCNDHAPELLRAALEHEPLPREPEPVKAFQNKYFCEDCGAPGKTLEGGVILKSCDCGVGYAAFNPYGT